MIETGENFGTMGFYGPNDDGYLCLEIREVAKKLQRCSELWSEGHYPHSNARVMPHNHPIRIALLELAKVDKEIAKYANLEHDINLFEPYEPSLENQTRWNEPYLHGCNGHLIG